LRRLIRTTAPGGKLRRARVRRRPALNTLAWTVALGLPMSACARHTPAPRIEPVPFPPTSAPLAVQPRGAATAPRLRSILASDLATAAQLARGRAQGAALRTALRWVRAADAAASGEVAAGPYLVTYLLTAATPYFDGSDRPGLLARHDLESPGEVLLGVVIRDAADGRPVPGLNVRGLLTGADGAARTVALPFGWYPVLNRYGENVVLPDAPVAMRIEIAPATFARHDSANGRRFTHGAVALFSQVAPRAGALERAAGRSAVRSPLSDRRIARDEGLAVARAIRSLAHGGVQVTRRGGAYQVTVATSAPSGEWRWEDGTVRYAPASPSHAGAHVDVFVREASTGRIVPALDVRVIPLGPVGAPAGGECSLQFMWDPVVSHYGANCTLSRGDVRSVRVRIAPPQFRRYGLDAGVLFARPVNILFPRVWHRTRSRDLHRPGEIR